MMLHLEGFGDRVGLIDTAGSSPSDIEFLQADDIRLRRGDYFGNALRRKPAIGADTTVHIIGQKFQATGSRRSGGW
ncbi:hypothetical protein D3C87_1882140 [compost metagenome]